MRKYQNHRSKKDGEKEMGRRKGQKIEITQESGKDAMWRSSRIDQIAEDLWLYGNVTVNLTNLFNNMC